MSATPYQSKLRLRVALGRDFAQVMDVRVDRADISAEMQSGANSVIRELDEIPRGYARVSISPDIACVMLLRHHLDTTALRNPFIVGGTILGRLDFGRPYHRRGNLAIVLIIDPKYSPCFAQVDHITATKSTPIPA